MATASSDPQGRAPATESAAPNRGRRPGRSRVAAARGAWAVGSVMTGIARIVRLLVGIIVLLIVAAILLRVLGANQSNTIVRDIHDVAQTLVGPFKSVFSIKNPKLSIAVNWGLAALVWLVVGSLIARLIGRAAPRGAAPGEAV
jgi:hypothetical protein